MGMTEWIAKLDSMTPEEKLATIELTDVQFNGDTMTLSWAGIIGFGEYRIEIKRETEMNEESGYEFTKSFTAIGESEHMDIRNDDKRFLRHLLGQLAGMVDLSEEKERHADWEERQKQKGKSTNE